MNALIEYVKGKLQFEAKSKDLDLPIIETPTPKIKGKRERICTACKGSGNSAVTDVFGQYKICSRCNGSGNISTEYETV